MGGVFARLSTICAGDWRLYVEHDFVTQLAAGTLPETAFRQYLVQDYLFLIHFARAWGLALYKSDNVEDMRHAAATAAAILDIEMGLHVEFCRGWGLTEEAMSNEPEAGATMAYTRYVLEKGLAGDILDLHVALAPCIVGYGVIGARLATDPAFDRNTNAYAAWVDMYAGDEYQNIATASAARLDRLFSARGGEARFDSLAKIFGEATRLEANFWQMGLDAAG